MHEDLTPREIIAKAWQLTREERGIRRWGYVSAVLETLLNLKLLIYQTWFIISYLQGDPIGFFTIEAVLMEHLPFGLFLTFMITLVVIIIVEWLFPHMATGAIIGLAAKSLRKEEVKGGLVLGIYNFFPIFAIHEFFMLSRITVLITVCSLILRYGGQAATLGLIVVISIYVFSNVLRFFFIFAEEAVVIRKEGIRKALRVSFKLVISYLGHIIFLILLFFIITLRIFINAAMIVLVPGIIMGIGYVLTLFLPPAFSYTIGSIIALALIGVASYFFAYLEVFRQTVWTLTYMVLSEKKELDVIVESKE